jgi:hypothetical protein
MLYVQIYQEDSGITINVTNKYKWLRIRLEGYLLKDLKSGFYLVINFLP